LNTVVLVAAVPCVRGVHQRRRYLCGGAAQPVPVHIDVDVDVAGSVFDLAVQCVDLSLRLCGVGFDVDVMLAGQAPVYFLAPPFSGFVGVPADLAEGALDALAIFDVSGRTRTNTSAIEGMTGYLFAAGDRAAAYGFLTGMGMKPFCGSNLPLPRFNSSVPRRLAPGACLLPRLRDAAESQRGGGQKPGCLAV
jgi:hypothetical protein